MKKPLLLLLLLLLSSCQAREFAGLADFDDERRLRALRLISVFENGTIELQYDYVENLDDGRGLTCGLGFTTATGDALEVVERYAEEEEEEGAAAFSSFLPELRRLADEESDDVTGLDGFAEAWAEAANHEAFRVIQEDVQEEQSLAPARAHAEELGLKMNLALVILLDSEWMHGDGGDRDGVPALLDRTAPLGDRSDAEVAWMTDFLIVRRADLENPADPDTAEEWGEAIPRVDVLQDLVDDGNFNFDGPLAVGRGFDVVVP